MPSEEHKYNFARANRSPMYVGTRVVWHEVKNTYSIMTFVTNIPGNIGEFRLGILTGISVLSWKSRGPRIAGAKNRKKTKPLTT